jgi:bilirubin oxidase
MINNYWKKNALIIMLSAFVIPLNGFSQNPLFIPDTISGTIFNLSVQTGSKQFIGTNNTPTFGYNSSFLGPTLLINKGDSITLNVTNNLSQATTVHWHGFHVSPMNDGGPHQIIDPGATWSPAFKMRNEAATFWYHPHGEGKTEIQISKGLAGMIIVRDTTEANYILPRRYGIDDFPLIVQSKAFDVLYQFATATHEDSIMMVNGTIDPYLQVPRQVVRLRLLNASADRTYNFGLSDNSNFYLIGSDGGLLSQPYATNRVRLSSGERAEIIVDFSTYISGSQLYLKSYASELSRGIIGADSVGTSSIVIMEGYYSNPLNGADFNILRFDVTPTTLNPVTTIPSSFAPKIPLSESSMDVERSVHFSADTIISGDQGYVDGPFLMNETPFNMDSINIVIYLNDIEIWTLTNSTMVAHPFHIHDIEFYVLDINGNPPPAEYRGLKDVILVKPNDTVRFITQFTTFSDPVVPYMFHCHLLHHEDDGMMGTFLVIDPETIGIEEKMNDVSVSVFPNPGRNNIRILLNGFNTNEKTHLNIMDALGRTVLSGSIDNSDHLINVSKWSAGIYIISLKQNNYIIHKKIIIEK